MDSHIIHSEQRAGCYHTIGDLANIFKSFIGVNYLTLAYAFSQSGLVVGVVILAFVALITDHCCQLLVKCKRHLIHNICYNYMYEQRKDGDSVNASDVALLRSRLSKNMDYADIGILTCGKAGSFLVNLFLVITQIGFCVQYFIFIGNLSYQFFPGPLPTGNGSSNGNTTLSVSAFDLNQNLLDTNNYAAKTFDTSNVIRALADENVTNDGNITTVTPLVNITTASTTPSSENATTILPQNITTDVTTSEITTVPTTTLPDITTPFSDIVNSDTSTLLIILVVCPLPLYILFTMFRNVRQLAVISITANTSIIIGFVSLLIYIFIDYQVSDTYLLYNWSTLPVFVGQAIAAYEAIGLVIPIESSMGSNQDKFAIYFRSVLVFFTCIISILGIMGYVRFGADVQQILSQNLPIENPVIILINITLIVGILCTYPLQVFPIIEILEGLIFIKSSNEEPTIVTEDDLYLSGKCSEGTPLVRNQNEPIFGLPLATAVPDSVPTWKRNLFRAFVAVCICGLAILMRNVIAYVGALVGSIGSTALSYVLPCLFHLMINRRELPWYVVLKNILIMILGTACGLISFVVIVREMIVRL